MNNFEYGDELVNEGNDKIREALIEIRKLLLKGYSQKREACFYICEYLSLRPDLIKEFNDLWELCGSCHGYSPKR
ncbi:MAG: hypothetical protein QNJ63_21665 [Calothrix sp. MO_192.B10]|nr:hypothetical protein [Calothrix sp. MO_192.B10]